jgi:acetyl-CoA carboxylase biotin carboxyl carrier protein
MNIKEIKELTRLFTNAGLTVLEVTNGEEKVRLEKAPAPVVAASLLRAELPAAGEKPVEPAAKALSGEVDFNNMKEIKSPMVGVFYRAPSEDVKPFVEIGDSVKKGDVLCIIEAMKLMNEISAEADGKIVDICAENGQVVEFDQTLFKIF